MSQLVENSEWDFDEFTDDHFRTWSVHKRKYCIGEHCALHNPSDHPLKDARIALRGRSPFSMKPTGFAERICEHGIGHSDPDSVAFYDSIGEEGTGVHGCDGCCTGNYDAVQSSQRPRDSKGWGPHEHHFEYFDDENGHSGSFCECGEPDPTY